MEGSRGKWRGRGEWREVEESGGGRGEWREVEESGGE